MACFCSSSPCWDVLGTVHSDLCSFLSSGLPLFTDESTKARGEVLFQLEKTQLAKIQLFCLPLPAQPKFFPWRQIYRAPTVRKEHTVC